MLRPGSSTMREASVPTLSALVDNMHEETDMSGRPKSCEHQPSMSVRFVLYMVVLLLAVHMIASTMLYVYLSMRVDKVGGKPAPATPGHARTSGNQTWPEGDLIRRCVEQCLMPGAQERRGKGGVAAFDAQIGGRPDGHDSKSPQPTAAHLIASVPVANSFPGVTFPSNKGQPIKHWVATGFPAFTRNVNYTHGKLVITEPGLYFVYCQVSFRLSSSGSKVTSNVPFVQYINLESDPQHSTMLMKASKTPVDRNQASSFNSVNQGGVFQLKKGHKLFVSVTSTDLLSYDKDTYFGIFRL
ncbi:CD40 ligand-like [Leucoraja erinacea]|uniref:CD40 ligand-like n=1 Tax=Leucoraja erinaceus TaxID=7782 RepID=UPI0024553CAB|nr:CD40 ligand-like [Leucoraja erinacea]